jgi:hypothetical protein
MEQQDYSVVGDCGVDSEYFDWDDVVGVDVELNFH